MSILNIDDIIRRRRPRVCRAGQVHIVVISKTERSSTDSAVNVARVIVRDDNLVSSLAKNVIEVLELFGSKTRTFSLQTSAIGVSDGNQAMNWAPS